MLKRFAGASLALALGLAATPSAAATYLFSLAGSGYTASGTLTTNPTPLPAAYPCPTCAVGPAYMVTGITGTINGNAITGMLPLLAFAGNNNLLYPAAGPHLDWGDLGFAAGGISYDVFLADYAGHPGYHILASNVPTNLYMPVSFTLSDVPEPASWALMVIGFGVIGGAARRRSALPAVA